MSEIPIKRIRDEMIEYVARRICCQQFTCAMDSMVCNQLWETYKSFVDVALIAITDFDGGKRA